MTAGPPQEEPAGTGDAYRRCAEIARRSGTSFYRGMRLLPRPKRDALFAIYAFARRVDDVADGDLPAESKLASLASLRRGLSERDGRPDDAVLTALADACRRFPIPLDAFDDLVAGAEMDVRGAAYATVDELVVYCRRVGGSIGRLAVGVFGARDRERALDLADRLGVAFQLTNILRDVGEDLAAGRVYLPREDLDAFSCDLAAGPDGEAFARLVRFEAARAESWYDEGLALLPLLDRASAASVSAMAGAYRRLLRRVEREPEAVLTRRVSLPPWEKGWVAARSLVGAAT
jgi:phytoene synthase